MPIKGAKGIGVRPLGYGLGAGEATDAEFNQTVLLLHGDGSEGAGDTPNLGDPNYKAFRDNSTSNHAITVLGNSYGNDFSPYYYADGYWSNRFDGSGDFFSITASSDFLYKGDFTIEFWILPNVFVDYKMVFGTGGSGQQDQLWIFANGTMGYWDGGAFTYSPALNLGVWNHCAVTRSGTTMRAYANGVSGTSGTKSGNLGSSSNALRIGERSDGLYDLDGYLSNLRVVNGAAVYTGASLTVPTTPLTDPSVAGEMSVEFDGTGDYLQAGSNTELAPGSGDFTIECFVKAVGNANYMAFYQNHTDGNGRATALRIGIYQTDNTRLIVQTQATSLILTATGVLQSNAWNHVALVRNGSGSNNLVLYVNGVSVGTATNTTDFSDDYAQIGNATYSSIDYEWDGYISNFRIVKGTALYTSAFTPSTSPFTTTSQGATASEVKLLTCQSKSFVDESDSNHGITVNGNPYITQFSPFNDGYWSNYFDGTGDYLSCGSDSGFAMGTGDFTWEAWIYFASGSTYRQIFSTRAGATSSSTEGSLAVNTGNGLTWYTSGFIINTSSAVPTNQFSHVAISRSGTSLRVFVNGVQDGSATNSDDLTGNTFTIGANGNGSEPFNGYISNVRVVKGTALYTSNFTPSTSPFTTTSQSATASEVKLLTCQSNRFIDNSNSAHSITVNGNTSIDEFIPFELLSRQTKLIICQGNRFKDIIPDRHTLTVSGDPEVSTNTPFTVTKTANVGSGFFKKSTDYLTSSNTGANFGTSDFTMECWVYYTALPASLSGDHYIFGRNGGSNSALFYLYNASGTYKLTFRDPDVGSRIEAAFTPVTHEWMHVAAVRSGTTITLYKNGQALTQQLTGDAGSHSYTCDEITVGGNTTDNGRHDGYIADARVVNGTAVYTSNFTPPTSSLTAVTNTTFLTCQYSGAVRNISFVDDSKYNFPITRNGDVNMGTFSPFSLEDGYWSNHFPGSSELESASSTTFNITDYVTLECWVYFDSLGPDVIVGREANYWLAYNNTGVGGTANKFVFTINNGSWTQAVSSSTTPVVGQWYHILGVKDGTTLRFYLNGTQENTSTFTGSPTNSGYAFSIGSYRGLESMNGYLSNVRLVTGSSSAVFPYSGLTSGSSFSVPTTPLTAVSGTQILTCQSNGFVDNSTNGHSVSVGAGTPKVQPFSPFAPSRAYSKDVVGGSAYFDGTTDYLNLPASTPEHNFGDGDFTVEAWIYQTAYNTTGAGWINLWNSSNTAWYLGTTSAPSANMFAFAYSTSGAFQSGNIINSGYLVKLNEWGHYAATRSGNTVRAFVNGVQVGSLDATGDTFYSNPASQSVHIGVNASGSGSNWHFQGYITGARIIKGTALYTGTFTPPTAPFLDSDSNYSNTTLLTRFDNAGIIDHTMKNNLESEGNTRISGQQVKFGTGSMYFDGDSDFLRTEDVNDYLAMGSGDWTFELFVHATSLSGARFIWDQRPLSTQGAYPALYWTGSALDFYVSTGSRISGSSAISVDTWHHVALCKSSGSTKLFVDGTQVGSTYTDSNTYLASQNVFGTSGYDLSTAWWSGYMDEIRLTKGVARYTSNFTPPTKAFANK